MVKMLDKSEDEEEIEVIKTEDVMVDNTDMQFVLLAADLE